ncbi:MAG TPA: MarR family transcriptional regulator [Bacteroidetes bacterium]|nr:MarR family transcriptional regulator [Bacteroidota bacterium]
MKEKGDKELRSHIEEMAKMFEKMNFTPMQGRILSFLSFSGKSDKSFEEIVNFFQTSKSTVSNSLSYLISQKVVDYKTLTGKRKRYFFLTKNLPYLFTQQQLETIGHFKELSYKTLTFNNPDQREMNLLIHEWIRFANLFEKHIREALQNYEKDKASNILTSSEYTQS